MRRRLYAVFRRIGAGDPVTRARSAALRSRNFEMGGRRTSARLESPLWQAFDEICADHGVNRAGLARMIDARRVSGTGLTSALRIFLLSYYRAAARKETRSQTDEAFLTLIAALDNVGPSGEKPSVIPEKP